MSARICVCVPSSRPIPAAGDSGLQLRGQSWDSMIRDFLDNPNISNFGCSSAQIQADYNSWLVILDVDESGSTAKPNTVCCQMEAGTVHSSSVQAGASTPMPTRPNPPSQAHTALCGVTQSYLPVVPACGSRRRGWTSRAATSSRPQSPNADEEQHTSQVKSSQE